MITTEQDGTPCTALRLQARFNKLVAVGEKPGREAAQQRGRDFEALILDLLDLHGLLLRRSYHTADGSSEQIDGAIRLAGRVALVEAKWVESGLAASELFAFLGKVEGKFVGTIGVFVSYVELSANFVQALRAGRRQSILVVHGPSDLACIFDPAFPLGEYLEECVCRVSIDNLPHFSANAFTSKRGREERAEQVDKKKEIRKLLKQLSNIGASAKALAEAEPLPAIEANVQNLLTVFPKVLARTDPEPLRTQIPKYIEAAGKRLPEKEVPADVDFFQSTFPATILDPSYLPLVTSFAPRLQFAANERRDIAEGVLIGAWDENLGTYETENILAKATEALWPHLRDDPKRKLLTWFIHFVNSDRRSYFPQMQLAKGKLTDKSNEKLRDEVLRKMLASEFRNMMDHDDADLAWTRKWVERSFENTIQLLPPGHVTRLIESINDEFAATPSDRGTVRSTL